MPTVTETAADRMRFSNGAVDVEVTTAFGPRIIGFSLAGGDNLMAQLPDLELEWRPEQPSFRLRGGHRLWIAPEVRTMTYTPDDEPVTVTESGQAVTFATQPTSSSPFLKEMIVELDPQLAVVSVSHRLTYAGESSATVAAWAITMLPPAGTAILPFRVGAADQLQPDRNLVLWPYATIDDDLLVFADSHVEVRGGRQSPTKVGIAGYAGWGAYLLDGQAFIKRAAVDPSAHYADMGASLQVYANEHFIELETMGPLCTLATGEFAVHREAWELRSLGDGAGSVDDMAAELMAEIGR